MTDQQTPDPKAHHGRYLGGEKLSLWQLKLNEIIFGIDTPAGKGFDIALLIAILISIALVMLESVKEVRDIWAYELEIAEWVLTTLFTVEYILRLACVQHHVKYAFSFYGLVDLLSIIPGYLAQFYTGSHSLAIIRGLRLLRIFRILKIAHCMRETEVLWAALKATISKIAVFMAVVMILVLIMGSLMYLIEGEENGFTSIPRSLYWAIVTITTVGYGDIAPQTALGQTLAAIVMLLGYGIIIVPTGMFSAEIINAGREASQQVKKPCPRCRLTSHEVDAIYCRRCGDQLPEHSSGRVS